MLAALATFAKFAPAVFAPMLASTVRRRARGASAWRISGDPPPPSAFTRLQSLMLWPAIDPGLQTFYDRTIAYQAGRDSPFSIWGQVARLEPLRIAILVGVAALADRLSLPAPAQVA